MVQMPMTGCPAVSLWGAGSCVAVALWWDRLPHSVFWLHQRQVLMPPSGAFHDNLLTGDELKCIVRIFKLS